MKRATQQKSKSASSSRPPEPRVVSAVGTAAAGKGERGKAIDAAVQAAVDKAVAEGLINDHKEMLRRKADARARAKAEFRE